MKKPHTAVPAGRKALFPLLSALAALAVCLGSFSGRFPRLEVAGARITEEEYLRVLYQARSVVLSDHAAAGISLGDWSTETALGDPRRLTMECALELLREYYAVSSLAVERGYLADAGYDAMLRDLEEVNRRRQEALDTGAMVTGLPSFTVEDYLTYRAAQLRLRFCGDPGNPENQVTPEQLRQRYEADRDNLYRQPDSMELVFLTASGADDALARHFEALRQRALETGSLADALEEFPGLKGYCQEISVTPGTYSVYARSHGDVLACAAELPAGGISRVFRQEDWLCLVQCVERTVCLYAPLEDVESIVLQSIRESRYDRLIAERMEQTQVRVDPDRLYRFTAAQLP